MSHQQPISFVCKALTCSSIMDSVSKRGSMQPWTVLAMMHLHHLLHTPCQLVKPPSITRECSLTNCADRSLLLEQRTFTSCQSRCTSQMKSTAITQRTTWLCLRTTITMTMMTMAMMTTMITTMMTMAMMTTMTTTTMAMMTTMITTTMAMMTTMITTMETMMTMTTAITT